MVEGSAAWKPQATFALLTTAQQGVVPEPPAPEALAEADVQVDPAVTGGGHRGSDAPAEPSPRTRATG
jgi:hypothetical protein